MAFTFGLGSDTMLNQFQRDAGQFKLVDMSNNISKYTEAGSASGQAIQASYLDRTYSEFSRIMQKDQENDDAATFLFEYQALLRSRMQQMITELTAALTRDLDAAMSATRTAWNEPGKTPRQSAQGYSNNIEDAGAARMAYNFFTGYAAGVRPAGYSPPTAPGTIPVAPVPQTLAYTGAPSYDSGPNGPTSSKVPIDTSADASFYHATNGEVLRVAGTAVIQQSFVNDGLSRAVIDDLNVTHQRDSVFYDEVGGGFVAHTNSYRFTDPDAAGNRFDATNIGYTNTTMGVAGPNAGVNLNDDRWDQNGDFSATGTPDYQRFNQSGNVKNEFQRVLYDTIFELDQRNLLKDIFRLSEKNGFLNKVQIASTTSLNTGSQMQASILLNYVPANSQILPANAAAGIPAATNTTVPVASVGQFQAGDSVYVTIGGNRETALISNISPPLGTAPTQYRIITFNPPLSAIPDALSSVQTTRPDLGGKIELIVDRFSAFYHS
jgi:hypothetical protein